jgi:phosphoesterase RecJ-like protein
MSKSVDWPRFAELVRRHKRFLLTSHIRPDCDALGSELGMAIILETLGKEVMIVNGQKTPSMFEFLDPTRRIKALGADVSPQALDGFEVLIILDTSAWQQLGPMAEIVRSTHAKKVVIDHHESEDDLGAEPFKDTAAEATGRLVIEAADQLGVPLTPDLARPLFAALATDTGWFRFRSTTAESYRQAARLVEAGVCPQDLWTALYEQDTLARLKLRGRILSRAQTELEGRLIHTAVLESDFRETGAVRSDTEDMINLTLVVRGVEVAVILVEQPDQKFKVSFRSRSSVSCSRLAERFGGGGHHAAAGAMVPGPFEAARQAVLDAARAAMQ